MEKQKVNYWLMIVLSIWLGWLGIDRIIIKDKLGIVKLFTLGGCGVWWIIDIILWSVKFFDVEYETNEVTRIIGIIGMSIFGLLVIIKILTGSLNVAVDVEESSTPIEATASSIITEKPTVTTEPTEKPTPKPTEKPTPEPTIFYDTSITYDQLARTPDDYFGKGVVFTGKIVQILESDGVIDCRIAISSNYDKMMYCTYIYRVGESRLLEDDIIRFKAISMGIYTYTTIFGGEVSIPSVVIDEITQRP